MQLSIHSLFGNRQRLFETFDFLVKIVNSRILISNVHLKFAYLAFALKDILIVMMNFFREILGILK